MAARADQKMGSYNMITFDYQSWRCLLRFWKFRSNRIHLKGSGGGRPSLGIASAGAWRSLDSPQTASYELLKRTQ